MQSKADSWIEAITNTAVGFCVSWAAFALIISPIFSLNTDAAADFLITCFFTVISLLRQYIIRRLFNGRSVGAALLAATRTQQSTKNSDPDKRPT